MDESRGASATDLRRLDAANVRKSRRHPQPRDMKDPFVVVDIDRFDYPPPNERAGKLWRETIMVRFLGLGDICSSDPFEQAAVVSAWRDDREPQRTILHRAERQ